MIKLLIKFLFFLTFYSLNAQTSSVEMITHKVELGETMLMISKKYLVDPAEIYKLNKHAINGVSEGMVLEIPQSIESKEIIASKEIKKENEKLASLEKKNKKELSNISKNDSTLFEAHDSKDTDNKRFDLKNIKVNDKIQYIDYIVLSGETLNGLSKKFGITIDDITSQNKEILTKGLQAGQKLKILVSNNFTISDEDNIISSISSNNDSQIEINHTVIQEETLYSISKKYGVSIDNIQLDNEKIIKNGLKSGQKLIIKKTNEININSNTFDNNQVELNKNNKTIKHIVEKKETLYSISKKYNVSIDQIIVDNPILKHNELQVGQGLTIKTE